MLEFFSNKAAHPLASAREAKRILAGISTREPLAAVEDAGAWLESLGADESFKLPQRLDLLLVSPEERHQVPRRSACRSPQPRPS